MLNDILGSSGRFIRSGIAVLERRRDRIDVTAQLEGRADWIRSLSAWDGVIPACTFVVLGGLSLGGAAGRWQQGTPDAGNEWALARGLAAANGVLVALFYLLVAWLFLVRSPRRGSAASAPARVVALCGTFLMAPVGSLPPTTDDWRILLVSGVLMAGGIVFATFAALSLGRSFGLTPEARGLVTNGPYRFVRHPIYLGELAAALAVLIARIEPTTAVIWGAYAACQVTRAWLEERALARTFWAYDAYQSRTPFLLPWRIRRPER